ncbi:hypothetical protein BC6307_15105 [Sutcliffiella cohnii]|uniref:Uncharacterized protein n=3 Tax=Bacillaceae TaxID=186817 RepID=A0A223KT75_9BACI|nr:hypothetical protein BC6307_15105 [Sutcliffiella cohnii]
MAMIMTAYLLHHIQLYNLEKRFYFETNQVHDLEIMIKYVWDMLEAQIVNDEYVESGIKDFSTGEVEFNISEKEPLLTIVLRARALSGRVNDVKVIYDQNEKKVISWQQQ